MNEVDAIRSGSLFSVLFLRQHLKIFKNVSKQINGMYPKN